MGLFAGIILLLSGYSLSVEVTTEGLAWFLLGIVLLSPSTFINLVFGKVTNERK